jgi:hypothetical protein
LNGLTFTNSSIPAATSTLRQAYEEDKTSSIIAITPSAASLAICANLHQILYFIYLF